MVVVVGLKINYSGLLFGSIRFHRALCSSAKSMKPDMVYADHADQAGMLNPCVLQIFNMSDHAVLGY